MNGLVGKAESGRGCCFYYVYTRTGNEASANRKTNVRSGFPVADRTISAGEIGSVYIPALLAPPCSTAVLQQTNSNRLFTFNLPHLSQTSKTKQQQLLLPRILPLPIHLLYLRLTDKQQLFCFLVFISPSLFPNSSARIVQRGCCNISKPNNTLTNTRDNVKFKSSQLC